MIKFLFPFIPQNNSNLGFFIASLFNCHYGVFAFSGWFTTPWFHLTGPDPGPQKSVILIYGWTITVPGPKLQTTDLNIKTGWYHARGDTQSPSLFFFLCFEKKVRESVLFCMVSTGFDVKVIVCRQTLFYSRPLKITGTSVSSQKENKERWGIILNHLIVNKPPNVSNKPTEKRGLERGHYRP